MAAPKRRMPTILPKEGNSSVGEITTMEMPPKRRATQVCDGLQPQCTPCSKKALQCVLVTPTRLDSEQAKKLSEKSRTLTDLFELLKDQSEDAAIQAFWYIRQGWSPEDILESIGGGMSGRANPSLHLTNRSLLPPTQTPVEFQLVVQHPNVYPSLTPLDVAVLDLQLLGMRPLGVSSQQTRGRSILSYRQRPTTRSNITVDPKKIQNVDEFDNCATDLVSPRLQHLNIARWTNIKISSRFAAQAITLYLRMNQPWWAFFHTGLFLNDLVSGETRFCSRLLVNALLAWSTQSYAHYEPMAAALSTQFLDEASRIYDLERGEDSLTTVAATCLMSMTLTTLGMDKAIGYLQRENASMATRLGLYGEVNGEDNHDPSRSSPLDLHDENVKLAAGATAWGSFNFHMVISMSYRQEPLPKGRPRLPIPDEIWASDSFTSTCTYASVCQFWSTAFEMNQIYYSKNAAPSLSSAEAIFHKLLAWSDRLQEGVKRDLINNPDHVLNLHIWFHTAVIDIFRPFADQQPQPKLETFHAQTTHATPSAIIAASIQQLKRLIYQYRSGFESAKYSIIWQSGMLYLVNHILRMRNSDLFLPPSSNNTTTPENNNSNFMEPEARFYFLLCMRGYQHLARYMPFVSGIVQSLFAMAARQGVVLAEDAQRILDEVLSENQRSREFMSAYPVDLEVAPRDPPAATLEKLAEDFHELTVGTGTTTGSGHDDGSHENENGDTAATATATATVGVGVGVTVPLGWKGGVETMASMLPPLCESDEEGL